jgi:hypothetical protein
MRTEVHGRAIMTSTEEEKTYLLEYDMPIAEWPWWRLRSHPFTAASDEAARDAVVRLNHETYLELDGKRRHASVRVLLRCEGADRRLQIRPPWERLIRRGTETASLQEAA